MHLPDPEQHHGYTVEAVVSFLLLFDDTFFETRLYLALRAHC